MKTKLGPLTKLFLKIWPRMAMRLIARSQGIENSPFSELHDVLVNIKRVDIMPYHSGERGFIIILDRKTALYFNQDGDHFIYDGFEMGKYDKGDVTIFDAIHHD